MDMFLRVFTDGACSGNPGPGGWGAILLGPGERVRELGGGEPRTTNNRMEMTAALEALRSISSETGPVEIVTDSSYLVGGMTSWLAGWKRRSWKKIDGSPVLNRDIWEALEEAVLKRGPGGKVQWRLVRGHSGTPGNERADVIAVSFSQSSPEALYDGPLSEYGHDLTLESETGEAPIKEFYLSLVEGVLERHRTWNECAARVKNRKGVRFKKIRSLSEEARTLTSWGVSAGKESKEPR